MGREGLVRGVVFWAAVAAAVLAARRVLLPCLGPFLAGWLAAAAVRPAARWLSRRTGLGKRAASTLCLAVCWAGAGVALWWLGSLAFSQGAALLERLPGWYRQGFLPAARQAGVQAMHFLGRLGGPEARTALQGVAARMEPVLQQSVSSLSARALAAVGGFAGRLPAVALACSFTVLSSFFILPDYEEIGAFLLGQLPPRLAGPARASKDFLLSTVRQVLKAYLLIMVITFGEISLGLWLLRVDYYLIIGLAVAVLDILPVIGSGSILVPWGLWPGGGHPAALRRGHRHPHRVGAPGGGPPHRAFPPGDPDLHVRRDEAGGDGGAHPGPHGGDAAAVFAAERPYPPSAGGRSGQIAKIAVKLRCRII